MREKITVIVSSLLLGLIIGVFATGAYASGEIRNRDQQLGEYRELVDTIRADDQRIKDQTDVLGKRLDAIGAGINEASGIASTAGVQAGSITTALQKLIGNFKALQVLVGDLERDYGSLLRDYRSLRASLGLPVR